MSMSFDSVTSSFSSCNTLLLFLLKIQDFVDLETDIHRGIVTPSHVNNVDATVSANALFGITNGILSGLLITEVLDDPEIQVRTYCNSS